MNVHISSFGFWFHLEVEQQEAIDARIVEHESKVHGSIFTKALKANKQVSVILNGTWIEPTRRAKIEGKQRKDSDNMEGNGEVEFWWNVKILKGGEEWGITLNHTMYHMLMLMGKLFSTLLGYT